MRATNRRLIALALPTLMLGCSRPSDDPDTKASTAPAMTGTAAGRSDQLADQGYVRRVLADTGYDYGQCRRRPDLQSGAGASAQAGEVVVLLDSSGSMAARAGAGTRMDEARSAVTDFLASLPAGTRGGLAVFGDVGDNRESSKARSCQAPLHLLYPAATIDRARLTVAAAGLRPAGWTPLAAAIRSAAGAPPGGAARTLFVVSDGIESCGGDPVAAAREAKATAQVIVNVIGFDVRAPAEAAALRQVASAGGGSYQAASAGELSATLRRQLATAHRDNTTAMFEAMYAGHDCTIAGARREADAAIRRINDDRTAGRINSATALAASRASSARTLAALQGDVRHHQQNMRDTDSVNRGIENRMDALGR